MATANVIEGKPWTITGRPTVVGEMKSGLFSGKNIKLTIKDGPGGDKTASIGLSGDGMFSHNHKTENVLDDQPSYTLTATAEYTKKDGKKVTVDLADNCIVWPATLVINSKDEEDKPFKGFEFTASQTGASDPLPSPKTDGKGVSKLPLLAKALTDRITAVFPYEIISTASPALRTRDLKVKRNFIPKFVHKNFKGGGPFKQYVNLVNDTSDDEKTQATFFYGNEVEIEVGIDDGGYKGATGDVIFIQVTFGRESLRTEPEPQLKNAAPITDETTWPGTVTAPRNTLKNIYKGQVTLTKDEGTAKFKVDLGHAGGETCEIRLSGTKDHFVGAKVPVLKFVNWRRLYYFLLIPSVMEKDFDGKKPDKLDYKKGMTEAIKERLDPIFVEYKLYKSKLFDVSDTSKGHVDSEFVLMDGKRKKRYVHGGHWKAEGGGFTCTMPDVTMKVRVWDRAMSGNRTGAKLHEPILKKVAERYSAKDGNWYYPYRTTDGSDNKIRVAGLEWVATFGPNGTPDEYAAYMKDTVLEWQTAAAPDPAGATAGTYTVTDVNQGKSETVTFAGTDVALDGTATGSLDEFLRQLIEDDIPTLRSKKGKIKISIGGAWTTAGPTAEERTRFQAVKAAVGQSHTTANKKIPSHPGLADDGTPLKGAVDIDWFEHENILSTIIRLPDHPGALVGELTDTTVPLKVPFNLDWTGGIGGNALLNDQNLVYNKDQLVECARTCLHELGHSMGMTVTDGMTTPNSVNKRPPGTPEPKNVDSTPPGPYYANKTTDGGGARILHQGPHCAAGLDADWSKTGAELGKKAGTCIMWGAGEESANVYCPICVSYLKARRLDNISTDFNRADAKKL